MKIVSEEEKLAHRKVVLTEGLKGCLVGVGMAYGIVRAVKYRYPVRFSQMNTSIKTAMWAMPTILMGAFFADDGSVKFDEDIYRSDYLKKQEMEKLANYNKLSSTDKALHNLNENKYKIIVGAWATSLYGSWTLVNRDRYMTKAQKIVQARVYAQAFTVVLLLGTILLSMHENEMLKKSPPPVPEWKKYLQEQEEREKQGLVTATPQPQLHKQHPHQP
ncbi:predicted protein [Scheffersomyces stipitis CBS 6054]|uniref:HIG1 domain-containing protein n=1 Tax=Scheffersomyces stipitis (strain ATCC 58785 / CBS 6054 / NBRC 10063 / NRRL Y-11545) TaxID=322104 RepID=A3M0P9_PICST|nr:predicted protein [Scheffersomyces stipitis CBS 6054]ABN68571.2 predicted protein [Scheffersomyces stipitis CBS 6054]KAG2730709.1 hypothetical protein G9P44_006286 [Scheffersomyces stipitis]